MAGGDCVCLLFAAYLGLAGRVSQAVVDIDLAVVWQGLFLCLQSHPAVGQALAQSQAREAHDEDEGDQLLQIRYSRRARGALVSCLACVSVCT